MSRIDKAHKIFEFVFADVYIRRIGWYSSLLNRKVYYEFKQYQWNYLSSIFRLTVMMILILALPILQLTNSLMFIQNVWWFKLVEVLIK